MASNSHETLMKGAKDFVDDAKENITPNTVNQGSNVPNKPKIEDAHSEHKGEQKKDEKTEIDESDAKKLKKKLKKQRQREKKKSEKSDTNDEDAKQNRENTDDLKDCASIVPPADEDNKVSESTDSLANDKEVNDDKEIDETEEFDFLNGAAAFVSVALKKGNKKLANSKADKANAKVAHTEDIASAHNDYNTLCNSDVDNHDNNENETFIFVKGKRTKVLNAQESSVPFGVKAIELIMENKILLAIKYLVEAIQIDPSCIAHYVNRSFCYLRSKQYPLAIADAQHVLKNSQDTKTVMKAKYILAQAFCYVKNFGDAEKHLADCLSVIPHNIYFRTELTRLRVTQLTNLGFCERDAMRVLQNGTSTMDAIDMLVQDSANSGKDKPQVENTIFNEDEVYHSDDDQSDSNSVM